ncbi:MAG: hypothetical protein NT018_09085 [Armatimonadetes bacterium]|nr:hypothetical protein [Armatimonadota bacterium]
MKQKNSILKFVSRRITGQLFLAIIMLVMALSSAFGSETALQGKQIKFVTEQPKEKIWWLWGNKLGVDYYGTYDHTSSNRMFIKDPYGAMMEMPLFYFSPPDLSYMLTKKAKFPETITDYHIEEGGRHKLIDLKVDDLPLGEFKSWKNNGELGGGFSSMNGAPVVEMIKGRKALRFSISKIGTFDIDYQALTSDFTVSDYLGEGKPFTMSAWVYDTHESDIEEVGTLMSWHSIGGDHGTRLSFTNYNCDIGGLSYTSTGQKGEWKGALGLHGSNEWQYVTYVYTGGQDGELRVYADAKLVSTCKYDNITRRRPLEVEKIGATSAVIKADLLAKSGKASVGLYYDEVDHHLWFQQRHYLWQNEMKIAWAPAGEVRFDLKDLKPGTKYYYRIMSIDLNDDWWSYAYNPMRRWAYGPGIFVTATADGKPGYNVPEDTRKHFFIGANWGSRWYYGYPGPADWLDCSVGDMKLFDYAMDDLEVRMNGGLVNAFAPVPANDAALMEMKTGFSWQQGSKGVAKYKVYRSTDKAKVANGTAESFVIDKPELGSIELDYGTRYYWRVAQLDASGNVKTDGDVWTFRTINGEARLPNPSDDTTINPIYEFKWTPGVKGTKKQDLYIAESVEELEKMTKPTVEIASQQENPGSSYTPGPDRLKHGLTYYWRVDTTQANGVLTPGKTWSFHVRDYFTPEPDSIVAEPLPDDNIDAVPGAKMMYSSMGFPGLVSPGASNEALLQTAIGTRRYLEKSRDARDIAYQWNCGHVLGSYEGSYYARGFMTGSYGGFLNQNGREILGILLFHETGHQMHGVFNSSDPAFRMINRNVWLGHADDNADLGGYGANNEFEQMAVACQAFMTAFSRENMYRKNRGQYLALQPHMPGDLCIELNADYGLDKDENGVLQAWNNKGGLLAWNQDRWANVDGTVGKFKAIGIPKVETVRGVSAVTFSGNEALEWDLQTQYGLDENRDFSIEFWALKNEEGAPNQVLAGWGSETNGARFFWGSDDVSYKHCGNISGKWGTGPTIGEWQHIVHIYRGGGKDNTAGQYLIYLNGKLIQEGKHKFNLGQNASVFVAGVPTDGKVSGGFKGSIAHVRVYNYDISHWQVEDHFAEEAGFYRKPFGNVADTLYVDMDVRWLADMPRLEHNPLYPEKMHMPWLRSWSNHGTLSGRLHNDIHSYMWGPSNSTPTPKNINGINAPVFSGKDRMVSGFTPDTEMLANPPGTLEAWVYSDALSNDEVVLEWGKFALDTRFLKKGWQHIGLVFPGKGTEGKTIVYINGEKAGELDQALRPEKYDRLHVGGHYDTVRWNWKHYFNGAVAAIRVHKRILTPEQLAENFKNHVFMQAHDPSPAMAEMVVAGRKPNLSWASGVVVGKAKDTIYLGESSTDLKSLGESAPGECKPILDAGKRYFWRVGNSAIWSFETRKGAMVDLDASDLKDGDLTKWVNKGINACIFTPGIIPDSWTPVAKLFRGTTGIDLMAGRRMISTFDAPAAMANGRFSIYYKAVRPIVAGGIPILSWGDKDSGAVFAHTTDAPFSWMGKGNQQIKIDRYPKDERGKQLATISAMAWFWKSICITYEDSTFKYYCDGHLVNEVKQEFSLANAGKLIIGGARGDECVLKELKVFSKALTSKEVESLGDNKSVAPGDLLVSVTAPDQKDGTRVPSLKNTGKLKGEFVAIAPASQDNIPSVKTVDGVKCAYFNGEAEFLASDKVMPEEFASAHPFTVEALIRSENQGVFLALAPEVAADGCGTDNITRHLDFSARGIRNHWGRGIEGNKWTHVALVYDGGYWSTFKVYVDGALIKDATKTFTSLATVAGYPMYVGSLFNTYGGVVNPFKGGIASIKAYDYVRTPEEIAEAANKLNPLVAGK